jgi:hypothetical protein
VVRELDLISVPTVPLPRAPLRWETEKAPTYRVPTDAFEVDDAPGWFIGSIESIPKSERPDPAFRKVYGMAGGLFYHDDLGKSEEFVDAVGAGLAFDQQGTEVARAAFTSDFYRISAHPAVAGVIGLSRSGELHAYDARLNELFRTSVGASPEFQALRRRIHPPGESGGMGSQ